jgi:7,8-dihydropterin-6-yl-methyl-4-(beta-D-ribofuranosyl)aminobenzene 5'-phosphate synthase
MKVMEVDRIRVTTLVENRIDPFVPEREGLRRRHPEEGCFLAEHGWAALIETMAGGESHTILLDAGLSEGTLLHNMRCLEIEPEIIEALVVSHGHGDHTGAVMSLLRHLGRPLPIHAHPAAFRERWYIPPDGPRRGPWRVKREKWEAAGGRIVAKEGPREVAPGCVVTGAVPRETDFERPPKHRYHRENGAFFPDTLPDDQAVVAVVRGKGLAVISGCAHAGIVNTVRYAGRIAGQERVWTVAGGFHLGGASAAQIEATIAGLRAAGPGLVAPGHCTGFAALCAFARSMPGRFALNVVGTVIDSEAGEP